MVPSVEAMAYESGPLNPPVSSGGSWELGGDWVGGSVGGELVGGSDAFLAASQLRFSPLPSWPSDVNRLGLAVHVCVSLAELG